MTKESLSATSALVLLWTDESLYTRPEVHHYWSMLDLSSGINLYEKCNRIWPSYRSVINDRKWLIAKWSMEILLAGKIKQVVIWAAGWAPLGLELAACFQDANVFEVDLEIMSAKSKLVSQIPHVPQNINFVSADISERNQCVDLLQASGWSPTEPSLFIYEGISYYLSRSALVNLFNLASNQSRSIFEYLVPYDQVEPARREIPINVFKTIASDCLLSSPIETWDLSEIRKRIPGRIVRKATLYDIERMRHKNSTECQTTFPTSSSGWIEVVDIEKGQS